MKKLTCLLVVSFVAVTVFGSVSLAETPENENRPNVLFIVADDLGWRDLSNEGSTFYESPNIDRIAYSGMKFTRGYATCQVCSPSRASLMTGKYPARLAITDWIGAPEGEQWKRNTPLLPPTYNHALPAGDTTIAEAFRNGGYKTFFAGKWHLGGEGSLPQDHGFDVNIGGHHRGSPPGGFFAPWKNPQMKSGPKGELLPLRLGQDTANFIEQNKDEPFFACLSFYSVHAPLQTTRTLWKKYRDKALKANADIENRFIVDRTTPVRQVQDNPLYGGMVESMDDGVGIVLAKLDELGLTENTIIVFTSDNGGVSAGDGKATSNLPLRGGKGRQWEGGVREPFYIAWPKTIPAMSTCDTPVIGTDFYPTLLELAGLDQIPEQHVDGVSLVPLLKGESIDRKTLFWHYPHYGNQGGEPSSMIVQGDWKLIHYYEDGRDELYNIGDDVGEQNDLVATNPEKAKSLRNTLDQWLGSVDARMPLTNPSFDRAKFEKQQNSIREKLKPTLEREHADFLKADFVPRAGWWEETGK